jgi:hypothetical protein
MTTMNRVFSRLLLAGAVLLLRLPLVSAADESPASPDAVPPNIVLLFADDLEYRHNDKWRDEAKWRFLPKLFRFQRSPNPRQLEAIEGN